MIQVTFIHGLSFMIHQEIDLKFSKVASLLSPLWWISWNSTRVDSQVRPLWRISRLLHGEKTESTAGPKWSRGGQKWGRGGQKWGQKTGKKTWIFKFKSPSRWSYPMRFGGKVYQTYCYNTPKQLFLIIIPARVIQVPALQPSRGTTSLLTLTQTLTLTLVSRFHNFIHNFFTWCRKLLLKVELQWSWHSLFFPIFSFSEIQNNFSKKWRQKVGIFLPVLASNATV